MCVCFCQIIPDDRVLLFAVSVYECIDVSLYFILYSAPNDTQFTHL